MCCLSSTLQVLCLTADLEAIVDDVKMHDLRCGNK